MERVYGFASLLRLGAAQVAWGEDTCSEPHHVLSGWGIALGRQKCWIPSVNSFFLLYICGTATPYCDLSNIRCLKAIFLSFCTFKSLPALRRRVQIESTPTVYILMPKPSYVN